VGKGGEGGVAKGGEGTGGEGKGGQGRGNSPPPPQNILGLTPLAFDTLHLLFGTRYLELYWTPHLLTVFNLG